MAEQEEQPAEVVSEKMEAIYHHRRQRVFLILSGIFLGTLALLNVLGIYCLFGANLISRLKVTILERESRTQWVRQLVAGTRS